LHRYDRDVSLPSSPFYWSDESLSKKYPMLIPRPILLFVCALFVAELASAADRPNIVFIFADDWGWGDLSCHGHKSFRTPNIDRLAAQGIDFHKFNVCNPVCSPSRTAAMTGHFPARYGVYQHFAAHALNRQRGMPDWLDPKAPMISRMLQQAGYRTGHFGKWHLTAETIPDAPHPRDYCFDESAVYNGPPPHTTSDHMTNEAVTFIRKNKDRPFFVNVWLHETHVPHYPSKAALAAHDGLDERHRVYAAAIADGDRKVGLVVDALAELELDDNTLVIFSSDNGPEWTGSESMKIIRDGLGTYYSVGDTAGRRGRKRSLFEGGVNVPFIVRWPGHAPAGVKDKATVIAAVDLLPTFCAVANVQLPDDYQPDGENMLRAFKGHSVVRSKPLFWEWRGPNAEPDLWPRLAVRDGDWKLVIGQTAERVELHNLANDPHERQNQASKEPDRVAHLSKMAIEWRNSLPADPPEDCISKQELPASPKKAKDLRGIR
jgi:arylsulfatase A-like enzyme